MLKLIICITDIYKYYSTMKKPAYGMINYYGGGIDKIIEIFNFFYQKLYKEPSVK